MARLVITECVSLDGGRYEPRQPYDSAGIARARRRPAGVHQ
jgi:hypothetical protein